MKKSRATGLPVALVVCALTVAGNRGWAQENPPSPNETAAQPSSTAPAADTADTTPIPEITVTTKAKKKKTAAKKKVTTSDQGAGSGDGQTDQSPDSDDGGVAGDMNGDATDGVVLGGPAIADTGTTVFDANNVRMRTDGSGDANTFLRNLPNVQYQNDTSIDAGVNAQSLIDTKPLEPSINGARPYENNFIVNGVSTKTITGTVERTSDPLSDTTLTPNIDSIYGLHSQQLFIPAEFLDKATVIDSNASAEYGEFMGGVILYDLTAPPTDRYRASVDFSRHTDRMTNFILATEDGLNPNDRKQPKFEKNNLAASLGAPITNDLAFIVQASQKTAEAQKQKHYTLYSGDITEDSENNFFRGAVSLKSGIGKFTLDSSLTDYHQYWEGNQYRDLAITTDTQSSSTQLKHETELPALQLSGIGLGGVKLESRAYYNSSEATNLSDGDTVWNWVGARRSRNAATGVWTESFRTSVLSDWCRPVPIETLPNSGSAANLTCREGGYADMLQGQEDVGLNAKMTGDILFGSFKVGGELKSVEGHRARLEDYTMYGVSTIVPTGRTIICTSDDDACNSEQYASSRNIAPAFDVKATVNALHFYSEIDQTIGWFNIRAGARVDYEDYFENLNIAPRLAGTVTPISGLSFTGGFNRYYEGESLFYALRDQQPRAVPAYSRSLQSNGYLSPWSTSQNGATYTYLDDGAETPFADEYTGTVRIREPLLGGQIRLKYLERHSEKQYSSDPCVGISNCKQLNNDGEKFYRSATAEYEKHWHTTNTPYLNEAAVTIGLTWSEQTANAARNTYYDDIEDLDGNGIPDNPILYNGHSYTRAGFDFVTGNLDIPIRVGATLSTVWFNNVLELNFSAGYNFGYEGVYDTDDIELFEDENGVVRNHDVWSDKKFKTTLKLDVSGQINVSENAAINFDIYNITNSTGNSVATYNNPWVIGRSYWVGSTVRF
jgi:hypothetical protein